MIQHSLDLPILLNLSVILFPTSICLFVQYDLKIDHHHETMSETFNSDAF